MERTTFRATPANLAIAAFCAVVLCAAAVAFPCTGTAHAATGQRMAAWGMPDRLSEPAMPADYSHVLMVGDSIMYLSQDYLRTVLPNVSIDAAPGRMLESGGPMEGYAEEDGVLDHLARVDRSYDYYIVGTGNNDNLGLWDYEAEWIVETLGADKQIFFVTEYYTADEFSTKVTNASIETMAQLHPNVHVIRWSELAQTNPGYYLDDAVHPSEAYGREAYALLIRDTLEAYESGKLAAEEEAARAACPFATWDEYVQETYPDGVEAANPDADYEAYYMNGD